MKMKKFLLPVLFIGVFAACQKENETSIIQSDVQPTEAKIAGITSITLPATYSQKLLMELYSTVSCATCPDSDQKFKNYATAHPDKIYGVNIHTADGMNSTQFMVLDALYTITQYSSGSFNRLPYAGTPVIHKTKWATSNMVNTCLAKTAKCGLKINSAFTGNVLNTTVTAGFAQSMTGNYSLSVYLMENGVTGTGFGFNQANYYNNIAGSQWYQLGNPIIGYVHNNVLRKVATPGTGTPIASTNIIPGGSYTSTLNIDCTGYNKANLYVIAFINKVGTSSTTHEIMNVQQVKAGLNKAFD